MKKTLVAATCILILLWFGTWSIQRVLLVSNIDVFQLPKKGSVALSDEALRREVAAVSFDEKRQVYLLDRKEWVVYKTIGRGKIDRIGLENEVERGKNLFAGSLAVNKKGSVFWCYFSGDAEKSFFTPYGSIVLLRAYSGTGKIIQQWQIPVEAGDIGYIQAVGDKSAFVTYGGHTAFYSIGKDQPRLSDDYVDSNDFVDWNGNIWNIYSDNKEGHTPSDRVAGEVPRLSKERPSGMFDRHPLIQESNSPRDFLPFWHSPSSGLYFRKRVKEYEGQTQFGFGLYRMNDGNLIPIVDLIRLNDPLLQKLGQNINIGAALWGEGDSVILYGFEELPKNSSRLPNHYIFRVASVPRWKTWFSQKQ